MAAVPVVMFSYVNYQGLRRTVFVRHCPDVLATKVALESLLEADVTVGMDHVR